MSELDSYVQSWPCSQYFFTHSPFLSTWARLMPRKVIYFPSDPNSNRNNESRCLRVISCRLLSFSSASNLVILFLRFQEFQVWKILRNVPSKLSIMISFNNPDTSWVNIITYSKRKLHITEITTLEFKYLVFSERNLLSLYHRFWR